MSSQMRSYALSIILNIFFFSVFLLHTKVSHLFFPVSLNTMCDDAMVR